MFLCVEMPGQRHRASLGTSLPVDWRSHIANRLVELNKTILMMDCDSQSNLTAYTLSETKINQSWATDGYSIFRQLELVNRTIGDVYNRMPIQVSDNLNYVRLVWQSQGICRLDRLSQYRLE